MKLACRAKIFAFASLSLIMLLFLPPVQPSVTRSTNYGKLNQNQSGPAKFLHSYTYRPSIGHQSGASSPFSLPTVAPFSTNLQVVNWQGYTDPVLQHFLRTIRDGETNVIKGIYAPGKFALQVVQQPQDNWAYVSEAQGVVTQFQSATGSVTGLLAHNYLEGKRFYDLSVGEEVDLLYGNGLTRRYQVSSIYKYQKLNTNSLSSDMIDLSSGKRVTSGEVFKMLYTGSERVTLQTCLEGEGISNWGLYFVIAQPVMAAQ